MMRSHAFDLHYRTHCPVCGARLPDGRGCAECAAARLDASSRWPTRDGLLGAAALVFVVLALGAVVYGFGAAVGVWP